MFLDYLIVDDFLPDPENHINFAKKINYVSTLDHNILNVNVIGKKDNNGWRGYRSYPFSSLDESLHKNFCDYFYPRIFNLTNLRDDQVEYRHNTEVYYHFIPSIITYDINWWHLDYDHIFAGVIYLNPNPPKNSGTILRIPGNGEVTVENKFNRMVLYKAFLIHRPESGFGDTIDTARLTIPFFIKKLEIEKLPNLRDRKYIILHNPE
jgi:hypothetical protein